VEAILVRDPAHLSASIGQGIARIGVAAFAAAALIISVASGAYAQTTAPADQTVTPAAPAPAAGPAVPAPDKPIVAAPVSDPVIAQGTPPARRPAPKPTPFRAWYPVIDVVVTFTQPAYYGNRNAVPTTGLSPVNLYDPLDVGGTVRIPVTPKLNFLFDRITEGTINQPLECVLQAAAPNPPGLPAARVCPSDSRDIILQYHGTYAFDRFVTLDVGDSFRHRIWTNGGNGVSTVPYLCNNSGRSTGPNCTVSSTEHHYGYAGLTYTTKPWKELWNSVFALTETVGRQNIDHHVGMVCSAALVGALNAAGAGSQLTCPNGNGNVGYYDENPRQSQYWTTTQGITWLLPLDVRRGVTLSVNERWGTLNWYENPTILPTFGTTIGEPYRWNSANAIQLSKRFSPGFTLAMRHQDYHSVPQGTPFAPPNAIHVGSWDVIGTFHFDSKTWFGL
jgi:hypothetical protein